MKLIGKIIVLVGLCITGVAEAHVHLRDAAVRVLPPGVPNTALYLTIENDTYHDITFTHAESDVAERVEIHTHEHQQGVMKMRKLDSVTAVAQQTLSFQPGGLHLMLFGLKRPLKLGELIIVTLISESGARYDIEATAVKPGQEHSHHQHH